MTDHTSTKTIKTTLRSIKWGLIGEISFSPESLRNPYHTDQRTKVIHSVHNYLSRLLGMKTKKVMFFGNVEAKDGHFHLHFLGGQWGRPDDSTDWAKVSKELKDAIASWGLSFVYDIHPYDHDRVEDGIAYVAKDLYRFDSEAYYSKSLRNLFAEQN